MRFEMRTICIFETFHLRLFWNDGMFGVTLQQRHLTLTLSPTLYWSVIFDSILKSVAAQFGACNACRAIIHTDTYAKWMESILLPIRFAMDPLKAFSSNTLMHRHTAFEWYSMLISNINVLCVPSVDTLHARAHTKH